jgi:hypothetical protein
LLLLLFLLLQVSTDCVVVKIDLLHEFTKDIKLDVPPDDMTTTLRDAVARRVQWQRAGIDIDPDDADSVRTTEPQPQSPPLPPTFSEPRLSVFYRLPTEGYAQGGKFW